MLSNHPRLRWRWMGLSRVCVYLVFVIVPSMPFSSLRCILRQYPKESFVHLDCKLSRLSSAIIAICDKPQPKMPRISLANHIWMASSSAI